jgi:transposase InsO family protein
MSKRSYSTELQLAVKLGLIPLAILKRIPTSTQYDFKHRDFSALFGLNIAPQIQQSLLLIQQFAHDLQAQKNYQKAIQRRNALIRIKNIFLTIFTVHKGFSINKFSTQTKNKIVSTINRVRTIIGFQKALRYFKLSKHTFYAWQIQLKRCAISVIYKCPRIWPNQLTRFEVSALKELLLNPEFKYWPIASIAYFALKKKCLAISINTWYKYANILGISRPLPPHRRKKDTVGIRANYPDQFWHMDLTRFVMANNLPAYIFLVMDNFSRKILAYTVSLDKSASHAFLAIKKAYHFHRIKQQNSTKELPEIQLLVDDGSENKAAILDDYLATIPVSKIIAQQDIIFSNSIVEAGHKILKYGYLFRDPIPDFKTLQKHLAFAVSDYNNKRPHCSLNGLTPSEAYTNISLDTEQIKHQLNQAKKARIQTNRLASCPIC